MKTVYTLTIAVVLSLMIGGCGGSSTRKAEPSQETVETSPQEAVKSSPRETSTETQSPKSQASGPPRDVLGISAGLSMNDVCSKLNDQGVDYERDDVTRQVRFQNHPDWLTKENDVMIIFDESGGLGAVKIKTPMSLGQYVELEGTKHVERGGDQRQFGNAIAWVFGSTSAPDCIVSVVFIDETTSSVDYYWPPKTR